MCRSQHLQPTKSKHNITYPDHVNTIFFDVIVSVSVDGDDGRRKKTVHHEIYEQHSMQLHYKTSSSS